VAKSSGGTGGGDQEEAVAALTKAPTVNGITWGQSHQSLGARALSVQIWTGVKAG